MADQSNADLFSGSQLQLDVESIKALLRVAQAQQQQECFAPSSQINDTVYTPRTEENCSIIAASPNATLESTQHSMVNVDSCHDYSYTNTVKNKNKRSIKNFF